MSQIKAAFGSGYKIKVGITDETFSKYTDQFDLHLPTEEEVEPFRQQCRELFKKHGLSNIVELQKLHDEVLDRDDPSDKALEVGNSLASILEGLSEVVFKDLDEEEIKILRMNMNNYDRALFNQHMTSWIDYRSCF